MISCNLSETAAGEKILSQGTLRNHLTVHAHLEPVNYNAEFRLFLCHSVHCDTVAARAAASTVTLLIFLLVLGVL